MQLYEYVHRSRFPTYVAGEERKEKKEEEKYETRHVAQRLFPPNVSASRLVFGGQFKLQYTYPIHEQEYQRFTMYVPRRIR